MLKLTCWQLFFPIHCELNNNSIILFHPHCDTLYSINFFSLSEGTAEQSSWPRLLYYPGDRANLPCLPQGEATAYFWRKGNSFDGSEQIAYKFQGLPSQTEEGYGEKFKILENGTLSVFSVSQEDEGKYFCRVVSESSEYHASVTLHLKGMKQKSPRPFSQNIPNLFLV